MTRPVCAVCSRNARTVDTPRVKVRVEKALVLRDPEGLLVLARCHGDVCEHRIATRSLDDTISESDIEGLELFRG